MLAYRPLGREIALRRITVTHSPNRSAGKCNNRNRCGYDDQRDGHSAEARSMSIIPRTILPFAKSYWRCAGANEACAPKTPSAKHDLNWTVLRVMLGSFDFPSLSFAVPPPPRRRPYVLGRLNSDAPTNGFGHHERATRCPPPMHIVPCSGNGK